MTEPNSGHTWRGAVDRVEVRIVRPPRRFGRAVYIIGRSLSSPETTVVQRADGLWYPLTRDEEMMEYWPDPTFYLDDDVYDKLWSAMNVERPKETPDLLVALQDGVEDARRVRDQLLAVMLQPRIMPDPGLHGTS